MRIISITIIDAPCGAGKTEYAIRYMNEDCDRPFLYISPLREMFGRISGEGKYSGRGVNRHVFTPTTEGPGRTKLSDIKAMISVRVDIMSTHALFLKLDEQAIRLLKENDYRLIIDEALDAISVLPAKNGKGKNDNECNFQELKQRVDADEIDWCQSNNLIKIDTDNYNQIVWTGQKQGVEHRYRDLERIVQTGALSYVNDSFLVWSFPANALDAFDDIMVLTYRFNSSIFKGYLDFLGKSYEHKTVIRDEDNLTLADFSPEVELGNSYSGLINVCKVERLNAIGEWKKCHFPLSSSWYSERKNRELTKVLKDNTTNYFRHYCKASRGSVMWTSFKPYEKKLAPQGYTKKSDGNPTFVACNCKATEVHGGAYNLAYLVDRHLHPGVTAYLAQKNITIDNDEYALSELIQWVFRSRVRKGEEINIYIPSRRMRTLFLRWLGCEEPLRKTLNKRR